jgi:hypothetical protein
MKALRDENFLKTKNDSVSTLVCSVDGGRITLCVALFVDDKSAIEEIPR